MSIKSKIDYRNGLNQGEGGFSPVTGKVLRMPLGKTIRHSAAPRRQPHGLVDSVDTGTCLGDAMELYYL
jgi:hypothetical protein